MLTKNGYLLLEAFFNHRKNDSALNIEDQRIVVKGQETLRKSTAGQDIYCKWKDGSTLWEKLSNLKELCPIQVAKYEPAFNCWVHHVLKKRDRIISM